MHIYAHIVDIRHYIVTDQDIDQYIGRAEGRPPKLGVLQRLYKSTE